MDPLFRGRRQILRNIGSRTTVQYRTKTTPSHKTDLTIQHMKRLLALLFAASFAGCADTQVSAPTTVRSYPESRYATSRPNTSPEDSPYRTWTTVQLQQRRVELYRMVPQRQTRRGVPVYTTRGTNLPQQDEILAIEGELNRRYQTGDKTAELKRPIPGSVHL